MYFLWARHNHNKIAPCGMIKVFELNWTELNWGMTNNKWSFEPRGDLDLEHSDPIFFSQNIPAHENVSLKPLRSAAKGSISSSADNARNMLLLLLLLLLFFIAFI